MTSIAPSSSAPSRKGVWEPLPLIIYGYAVHPLTPNRRDTQFSRARLSTVTEASTDDHLVNKDVVPLEVGDEIYAFEKYVPQGGEVDGIWYRGYVVCTTRRPQVSWATASESSVSPIAKAPPKMEEPQQVFIGIFPASHIHMRDELSDAEGRLADVASSLNLNPRPIEIVNGDSRSSTAADANSVHESHWNKEKSSPHMTPVIEEDEDSHMIRKSIRPIMPPGLSTPSRTALAIYPPSVRSSSPDSQVLKPLPPRPSLKSGDDTISGGRQPIVDEIASALREWHTLMFQYLARRDYKLFHMVREHIEALHLGRRQLLAQTLSEDETTNLRRDCVARLVSGNIVQGLDIIVRHPTWGGLVTVDIEGETDPRSWVSAVRMYSTQVSLAYLDVLYPSDPKPNSISLAPIPDFSSSPHPTPAHSAFPEYPRAKARSVGSLSSPYYTKSTAAKFYHAFIDLRAFVASPCVPGETIELFFSLYNKSEQRFVSEEFCAVLNHNGVLARDPTTKIRTIFTDLANTDVQDPIYLVARIVRNGALKMGSSTGSSAGGDSARRASEASPRGDTSATTSFVEGTVPSPTAVLGPTSPTSFRGSPQGDGLNQIRRPFGCAVLHLADLTKMANDHADVSSTREYTMPIFIPVNETLFSMLHQDIINGNTKEYDKSPRADMIAVSVKIFHGDAATIVRENTSLLHNIPLTLRLGFPDVVFPDDVRNELYIKLWSGDFSSWHSSTGRLSVASLARGQVGNATSNVQVTVEVRDQDGRTVENVISQGSGEPLMTQFHSMVFQRCPMPTFGELLKVQLPLEGIPQWHLLFTFRNRSGREKPPSRGGGESGERPLAFAFLPLFPDNIAFIEDGIHTLVLYRADKLAQLTPETYLHATPLLLDKQKQDQIYSPVDMQRLAPVVKDTLIVRTSLCSTKLTQNPVLLSLLNWEKIKDRELLSTVLQKFTFVGEVEIVKFLRNIFDSLFGILGSQVNQSGEMDQLVFNALVTVLGIVQDRRFSNFQPVLDVYIEQHFNSAGASSHMIHSMNRLLANPTSSETASSLRAALKVWHYIFKFIARSRELQKAKEIGMGGGATAEHLEATFKKELRAHLSEVNRMMSMTSPASAIGTQTIALQHFTSILPELAKIFSTVELVTIATTFANAVAINKGKIIIWKLIMYLQIVKGFLFDQPQSRSLLVEAVVIWIKPHFGRFDEYAFTQPNDSEATRDAARISWLESVRLCVTIVAVMLDRLQQNLVKPENVADRNALRQEQDNVEYLLSLLPRLLDSYREFQNPASHRAVERARGPTTTPSSLPVSFPESYPFSLVAYLPQSTKGNPGTSPTEGLFNPGLGEVAIVFLALVLSSPRKHILNFLESSLEIEGKEHSAALLSQFFKVATSILQNDAFPSSWLNVNILTHKVLLKMMDPVATVLERDFIPEPENENQFDTSMWREGFYMLLKLLSSDQLVIEEFSAQKRRAVWRLAGDIRGEGAVILLKLWEALAMPKQTSPENGAPTQFGGYQVLMTPLVGYVVNLCLSHHDQLRNNAVQILCNMIVAEYQQSGHFDAIENELVNRLDSLFMSDSKGDDISRAFFIGQLRHLFDSSSVEEQLRERVTNFLDSVDLFLELLLTVRALPEGEEFADDRVIATLRLMNFIRRIGRDEMYIKYVHQLVNMHLQSQNYVEAALTLKLHSDLHDWDLQSFVPPMEDLGLPQQSQFHRKETLCLLILDYLGKGKAWEKAIEICKELAQQHAEVTFNYGRLSEILRHEAALLDHIVTDQRYYPDYYKVAFYGNFPVAIRGKHFIYRGYEWEKFGAFCERMLNKHPGAQLLKTMGDPPVDIRFGNTEYIQCTAVTPEPDRELPVFKNPDAPLAVRTYYERCAISLFSCSRPVPKQTRDGSEEIWIEKTYFTTEETFPTLLRRSEIVAFEVLTLSPLENAFNEVELKTQELKALELKYSALAKTTQPVSTNALAMSLNSAVDSPADAGIASYRQTFFSPEYIVNHPDRTEQVERLKKAVEDQARVIESCLRLHAQLCPQEFIPFHETLENFFKKNFKEEVQRLRGDTASERLPSSPTYQTSVSGFSLKRSMSSASTTRAPFTVPPIQLSRSVAVEPALLSPKSGSFVTTDTVKQTPLQRHLAHLARHGITGVSSAPGDMNGGTESISAESPRGSIVNVNSGAGAPPAAGYSGASVPSISNAARSGSIKGRISRFGSFNFGRRAGTTS